MGSYFEISILGDFPDGKLKFPVVILQCFLVTHLLKPEKRFSIDFFNDLSNFSLSLLFAVAYLAPFQITMMERFG